MLRSLTILCAVLLVTGCQKPPQQTANEATTVEAGPVKGIDRSHKGAPAPAAVFNNPDGGKISIAKFKGVPVLVNLWASWCAPCVKELPTLDQLVRAQGSKLNVVAISQDDGPHASVEAFLNTHKIATLDSYQDPKMALSGALGAEVLPTSVLYDAKGKEVWRYVGDQDWTSAGAVRLVDEAGAGKGS